MYTRGNYWRTLLKSLRLLQRNALSLKDSSKPSSFLSVGFVCLGFVLLFPRLAVLGSCLVKPGRFNTQGSSCLCLRGTGVKGTWHHTHMVLVSVFKLSLLFVAAILRRHQFWPFMNLQEGDCPGIRIRLLVELPKYQIPPAHSQSTWNKLGYNSGQPRWGGEPTPTCLEYQMTNR